MSILQNFPNTRPSLSINFARSQRLDPRITFTRTTIGTRTNGDGLIEVIPADQPRFDFDPVTGECLGLLIEEQRANRCTQSVNFNFGATSNTTETTIFNPDGTAAVRRVPLSTGNFHGTSSNAAVIDITGQSVGGTTDVTTSIFVRNYNNSNLRLLIGFVAFDATPTYRYFLSVINTANPTTLGIPSGVGWSNGSTKVENYGNGWYRYTLSGRYNKVAGFNTISFVGEQIHSSTGQQFWFGDDVSGIYTWGKQIELGLFSTSYIPTSGSTVTRTADNVSMVGENFSSWYNPSEGALCATYSRNVDKNNQMVAQIRNADGSNRIEIRGQGSSSNSFRIEVIEGNRPQQQEFTITPSGNAISTFHKCNLAYKQNNFASAINGTLYTDDTGVVGNCDRIVIGAANYGASGDFNGHISQLIYYPTALPSNQLVTLTK